jgi:hypothetical protein
MVVMDKKYAKHLGCLSGPELTTELYKVVDTIRETSGGFDQRTRDRGCYLVLENIGRVPEADQKALIRGMLEANQNPSRGVQSGLTSWKPTRMPSAATLAVIAGSIGGSLIECLKNVRHGEMSDDLFGEIEAILVEQDKHDVAAILAAVYAPSRLSRLADQMMMRAIEMCHEETHAEAVTVKKSIEEWNKTSEEEMAIIRSQPDARQIKSRRERLFRNAVSLSIKHKTGEALARMRNSAELNHGDGLYDPDFVDAAVIVGEEKWLEAAIQRVIKLMQSEHLEDYDYRLAQQAFDLVKEDRFAGYRQQLFSAIYRDHIVPARSCFYETSFLRLLAEMAVYFENKAWQDQVHGTAMKQMPNGIYGYTAYEAFIILAPVHETSQRTLASTPRPQYRLVLR